MSLRALAGIAVEEENRVELPGDISAALCSLHCAGEGMAELTRKEYAILMLIGEGKTSKEIGKVLRIAPGTVAEHRKKLCAKLNLHSTAELLACAIHTARGLCPHSPRRLKPETENAQ